MLRAGDLQPFVIQENWTFIALTERETLGASRCRHIPTVIIKPSDNSDGKGRYRFQAAQGNRCSSAEGRQSSAWHSVVVVGLLLTPHRLQTQR